MSSLILILLSIISVNSNIFIHLRRMNRKEDNGLPKYQINPKFINCLKQKPCLPIALLNHYQNTESVQLGVNFEFDIKYQFKDIQEKNIINTRLSICAMTTLQKTTKATNISNQINLQKKIRPVQMRIRTLFLNVYVQRVKTITSSVIPHSLKSNGGKKFKIIY